MGLTLFPFNLQSEYALSRLLGGCSSKFGLYGDRINGTHPEAFFPIQFKTHLPAKVQRLGGDSIGYGGASFRHSKASVASLGEAIERYSATFAQRADVLQKSRKELVGLNFPVIEAADLDVFADFQFEIPNFPYLKFTEDLVLDWVYMTELGTQKDVLVPISVCGRLGASQPMDQHYFIEPNSNGLASGVSKEQAILNGLLEVIERDAFCYSWWTKVGSPDVQFPLSGDSKQIERINSAIDGAKGKVKVLQLQTDLGIPVYAAIYRDPSSRTVPFLVVAACRLNPIDAIEKAIEELAHSYSFFRVQSPNLSNIDKDYDRSVRKFEDGSAVYLDPEMAKLTDFIWNGKSVSLDDLVAHTRSVQSLGDLVELLNSAGMSVYSYDFTTRDVARLGCEVWKVWVPELIPINGSHAVRPFAHQRLKTLGQKLGHRDHVLESSDFYPFPHPFP